MDRRTTSPRRRRRWRAALMGGALLAVALPATAQAAYEFERARFKVKVTAKQTTTWTVDRRDPFEICGQTSKGGGRQTLRLASKKAAVVHALFSYDTTRPREAQSVLLVGPYWQGTVAAKATVDRNGTMTTTPNSPQPCADGDGTGPSPAEPASDCGRKKTDAYLLLAHYPIGGYPATISPRPRTGVLGIQGPHGGTLSSTYRNCPFSGHQELLLSPSGKLKVSTLMGTRKRFTVRGRERAVHDSDGRHYTTKLTFKVSFVRLAKGKRPKPEPPPGACQDGRDNDADGRTDRGDDDCFRTRGRRES